MSIIRQLYHETLPLTSPHTLQTTTTAMDKENAITKYIHGLKCRMERIRKSARKKRKKSGCPLKRVPTPYPMSRVTNMPTSSGEKQAG